MTLSHGADFFACDAGIRSQVCRHTLVASSHESPERGLDVTAA